MITFAVFPATTIPAGTSFITTARAPTAQLSPTVTLGPMNAPVQIRTPLPIVMGVSWSGRSGRA